MDMVPDDSDLLINLNMNDIAPQLIKNVPVKVPEALSKDSDEVIGKLATVTPLEMLKD